MNPRFQPYFDRFEICEAFFAFAADCHSGMHSEAYRIFSRLNALQFSPGMGGGSWDSLLEDEKDNALEIYCNAWLDYYPGQPFPDEVQEWVRAHYVTEFVAALENAGALETGVTA